MIYRRTRPYNKHGFYQSMCTHKKYPRIIHRGFTMHRSNSYNKYMKNKMSKEYDFTYNNRYQFRMGVY